MIAAVNGMACGGAFYILGEADVIIAPRRHVLRPARQRTASTLDQLAHRVGLIGAVHAQVQRSRIIEVHRFDAHRPQSRG